MAKKYTRKITRQIPSENHENIEQILRSVIYEYFNPKNTSKYQVLVQRFGLNGKEPLTLDEVGLLRGVTRQRVQQLEKEAINQLRMLFETGESIGTRLHPDIVSILQSYRLSLEVLKPAKQQSIVLEHTGKFFGLASFDSSLLELLLNIYDFHLLRLTNGALVWIFSSIDSDRLEILINKSVKYLKEHSESRSWQDILLAISKQSKSARYKPEEIQFALKLAPEIEQLEDGEYQVRFEYLSATEDRVYRLLYRMAQTDPIELSEIVSMHNAEVIKHGSQPQSVAYISGAMSRDARFQNIGKSGNWVLTRWGYKPESLMGVPDIIERVLKHNPVGMSLDEIYLEVSKIRNVDRKHISSYLHDNPKRFVKLTNGLYGLRKSAKSASIAMPRQREKMGLTAVKLALSIEQIFLQHKTNDMKLADLRRELSILLPDYKPQSIWTMLSKSKVITKTGNAGSLVAHYNPSWRDTIPAVDLASNGERGIFIKRTIRDLLVKNKRMLLIDLRREVSVICHVTPHNVFAHVKDMTDIYRENGKLPKDKNGDFYCELVVHVPAEYEPILKQITDTLIRDDVARGLSNLTIDDVDLGLFILGRAFDVMSKRCFVKLAKDGKIKTKSGVVSEADAQDVKKFDLNGRIDLFVSNGFLLDKPALTTLRKERNDPAHNIQPLERRREMLITAQTYAKWYMEYIILFEEELAKK